MRTAILCACAVLSASAIADCGTSFSFSDFISSDGLTFEGQADTGSGVLFLTHASQGGAGAVWYTANQAGLLKGFTTTFTFSIQSGSADGFAFVIQNQSADAIGDGGSGIGYAGISSSVAIEFDTFGFSDELAIPHISVQTRGLDTNSNEDVDSIASRALPFPIDDGAPHDVMIQYTPGTLYVWLDGDPWLFAPLDLQSVLGGDSILSPDGCAWVGLTGGAGGATADQIVTQWSFDDYTQVAECVSVGLDGTSQSDLPETGDRVYIEWIVTGTGPRTYHWRVHEGAFFTDDARHTGASTYRMIVEPWIPADNVLYDFEAQNECSGLGVGSLNVGIRCPGDLNYDDIVEDSDFVVFVQAYDQLIVPDADKRCDWNGDGLVDDSDFVFFVRYYDDLLCPS